jgi:peptide/nickel transport system substrate-binding protein
MSKSKPNNKVDTKVSMKEAFDKISTKVNNRKRNLRRFDHNRNPFREFFWNYPDHVIRVWKLTSPLSTIFLFLIIGFGIFTFLRSDIFADKISSRQQNYYVEGRVGAISTFNPLFSNQNDIDKAIQELVFEKFLYIDANGEKLPGIANNWDVTDEGRTYIFDISLDHTWSDGTALTMDDVYFTFNTAIVLAKEHGYDTVASSLADVEIEVVDTDTIKFILPETNSVFPELASVYIVPKHILENVSLYEMPFDRFSRNPVGSGAYKVSRSEPNIVYLQASNYYLPTPNISNIVVRVYSDIDKLESAFRNGLLDAILLPNNESANFINEYNSFDSHRLDLPYRQRILFFNLRKEKLQNDSLREGLSLLIDKEKLMLESGITGQIANGPIYENSWAYSKDVNYPSFNPEEAERVLKEGGYSKNESNGYFETEDGKIFTLTISYLDNSINEHFLNTLSYLLNEQGVIINLEPLTYSQLTQEILATRNFEILMYEIELTVDPDQYNLWHSLQKEYPNLNLSGYEFSRIDIILEEARRQSDKDKRKERYSLFQKYLMADTPAIFLYRPSYIYVVRDGVTGIEYDNIVRLEDIYRNICTWQFEK